MFNLRPSHSFLRTDTAWLYSAKWLGVRIDVINQEQKFVFIQLFRKRKTRYLLKTFSGFPVPKFVLATGWDVSFVYRTLRIGKARRPFQANIFWTLLSGVTHEPRREKKLSLRERRATL